MVRVPVIGVALALTLMLGLSFLYDSQTRLHVPPGLEPSGCSGLPAREERPIARFAREGGRTTKYVRIWYENGALTANNVEQGRDLSSYEKLLAPDLGQITKPSKSLRDQLLAQARTFLWGHWQSRRPAYLVITMHSVDRMAASHIFVEQDDFHRWRIYERIVRKKEIDDIPTSYSMTWVHSAAWNVPETPLAPGEHPDAVSVRLEFRDLCGEWNGSL